MSISKPLRLNLQYYAEDEALDQNTHDFDFSEENEEIIEPQEEPKDEPVGRGFALAENSPPATEKANPPPAEEKPVLTPPVQEQAPSNPQLAALERFATSYGMNVDEYISAVEQQAHETQIQAQLEKGIPREVAERLLNLENQSKLL